jgi:hypothetical protein
MAEGHFFNLRDLVSRLSSKEQKVAMRHLTDYRNDVLARQTKMHALYESILKDPQIKYDKAKKLISPSHSKAVFTQLCKRTYNRLKESLILEVNIHREERYSKVFQKKFKLRKEIVQNQILSGRGMIEESWKENERLIKQAKRYELYDELLELLYTQQDKSVSYKGFKEYERLEQEIKKFENIRSLSQKARMALNAYYLRVNFSNSREGNFDLMKLTFNKLKKYATESGSNHIKSLANLIGMEYYFQIKDYKKNIVIGESFLELIRSSPSVNSKQREVYVFNNLISNAAYSGQFSLAESYLEKALKIKLTAGSKNLYKLLELKLFLNFYKENYGLVFELIEKLEQSILSKGELYRTKLNYYKSMLYFVRGEYSNASLLLRNLPLLELDKEGWNIHIRIMRILCSIEMNKVDLIDYDFSNFKKLVWRLNSKQPFHDRMKKLIDLLAKLESCNYDFNVFYAKNSAFINELGASIGSKFGWSPFGAEMILLHDWFYAKSHQQVYRPNLNRYQ